jgi:hypothetical protein
MNLKNYLIYVGFVIENCDEKFYLVNEIESKINNIYGMIYVISDINSFDIFNFYYSEIKQYKDLCIQYAKNPDVHSNSIKIYIEIINTLIEDLHNKIINKKKSKLLSANSKTFLLNLRLRN